MSDDLDLLSALIDDELAPAERVALEARLEAEPELAAELAELRELVSGVRDLPREAVPAGFSAQVLARVVPVAAARGAKAMHPENHGASGAKKRAELRAKARREAKRQQAAEAAQKLAEAQGKVGASQHKSAGGKRGDPFTSDPFAGSGPPKDPEAYTEQIHAFLDGELSDEERAAFEALLPHEPLLAEEVNSFKRLKRKLRGIGRIEAPTGFATGILDEIDRFEREEAQRLQSALDARRNLWQSITRIAQAACFMLVVGAGMALTSPREGRLSASVTSPRAPGHEHAKRNQAWGDYKPAGPPPAAEPSPPPAAAQLGAEGTDATWELSTTAGLDKADGAARKAVQTFSTVVEAEASGTKDKAYLAVVRRDQVDDLLNQFRRSSELGVPAAATETLDALNLERDRVVLKSGFTIVGQVTSAPDGTVTVLAGDARHVFPASAVETIDRASAPRKIRIVIGER